MLSVKQLQTECVATARYARPILYTLAIAASDGDAARYMNDKKRGTRERERIVARARPPLLPDASIVGQPPADTPAASASVDSKRSTLLRGTYVRVRNNDILHG